MIESMGWWSVPIVALVIFTLYGIEGIGSQLEDPFGYHRNDINMDAIVQDARTELNVMLNEWKKVSATNNATAEMFLHRTRPFISRTP
jgi:ion channel-forming bestrophin family protein